VNAAEPKRSALAPAPEWSTLERFQESITRKEFVHLLESVYAPDGAWKTVVDLDEKGATLHAPGSNRPDFRLRFASDRASARPVPRYWKAAAEPKRGKPLAGLTIAIDPGHIGGKWAQMEERWFRIGRSKPVMEGEMVLVVAKHLARQLGAMGAKVVHVRRRTAPVTRVRPSQLRGLALAELKRQGTSPIRRGYDGPNDPQKYRSIEWTSELLFYRTSEIRARAIVVNERLQPDLTICLHFNAESWGNPDRPELTDKNHLHLLVNGNYAASELALEDVRYDLFVKLLNRSAEVELPLSDSVARSLARATGLPPYVYHDRGRRVTPSEYVWARNLLANRLYHCPVVYCEPYVMNSRPVFERARLGDYNGTRLIHGVPRQSIFREYAAGVAQGVVDYFGKR